MWFQCAGLLECGQNNCAAKSGGYWDEEVHTDSQSMSGFKYFFLPRMTVARGGAPVSAPAAMARARAPLTLTARLGAGITSVDQSPA